MLRKHSLLDEAAQVESRCEASVCCDSENAAEEKRKTGSREMEAF